MVLLLYESSIQERGETYWLLFLGKVFQNNGGAVTKISLSVVTWLRSDRGDSGIPGFIVSAPSPVCHSWPWRYSQGHRWKNKGLCCGSSLVSFPFKLVSWAQFFFFNCVLLTSYSSIRVTFSAYSCYPQEWFFTDSIKIEEDFLEIYASFALHSGQQDLAPQQRCIHVRSQHRE